MNDDDWMMHVSWSPFLSDSEISESWSRNVQWGIFQAFHYVVLNWSGTFTDLSDFVFIKNCSLAILFCHSMVSFLNEQWQLRRPPLPHHDHSHTHSGTHSSLMQQYHLLASSRSLQIWMNVVDRILAKPFDVSPHLLWWPEERELPLLEWPAVTTDYNVY